MDVREIQRFINEWEKRCYKKGLPDEAPVELKDKVPSYKQIALCILNNNLKPLGIEGRKTKYYSVLKGIEIDKREFNGKQIKLIF
jgi:predicted phosphoadenosine phosphosulfate sulfurtransferase